jgi:glutaredoxin 3
MVKITIYTMEGCRYCTKAKDLLLSKNLNFTEIRVDLNVEKKLEMEKLSGRSSVPQIFINERHIGGCDDLCELDSNGKLDLILENH